MAPTTSTYDTIVLGVGTMGSAACYHLAKRGARVLGIDQASIPNDQSAHHGHSRMIRLAYYEHPHYVPLLRRAYELWDALEAEIGPGIFHRTGGLYLGEPDDPFVAGSQASAREHGLPHEMLSREDVLARYPQFVAPEAFVGFYEPEAGLIVPERAVKAHADLAREHGAELHEHERVVEFRPGEVVTERATYHAKHIVVTQGAWTQLPGVKLTVTRQVLGWVEPPRPERFTADRFPSFAISCGDGWAHYGFPILPDVPDPRGERGTLLKIAHHWHDRPTTPESINREPEPGDEADFRGALRQYLPDADGPLAAIKICMYTNSPDSHFIIDRHPRHDHVTVACGFSGHGFKFAPVIGEVLADLALDGRSPLPIDFLGLGRFED